MTASVYTMEGVLKMVGLMPQVQAAPAIANKYVVYERPDLEGVEGLRLGEPYDLHADMLPKGAKVLSAGFYQQVIIFEPYGSIEIRVWGYSESLGVTSRPTDASVIKAYLTR